MPFILPGGKKNCFGKAMFSGQRPIIFAVYADYNGFVVKGGEADF
jgi:hypothetical protein